MVVITVVEPPEVCDECRGGVTELTLEYLGVSAARVVVFDNEETYFDGDVQPGDEFSFSGTKADGKFEKNELDVTVDGSLNAEIHVSCSQPIGVGSIFGDFEVVGGTSKDGGDFCP